jgi:Fur family transcriptional regulator, ferric uptake regulator
VSRIEPPAKDERRVRHVTRQGELIGEVLGDVAEFRSAQEIHADLRQRGHPVGLTTVYRHLNLLAERGALDVLHTPEGETVYRRCAAVEHHHHLVCRSCGKTVEFEGEELERWADSVAHTAGFHDVSHTVEIFGTCDDCASRSAAPDRTITG